MTFKYVIVCLSVLLPTAALLYPYVSGVWLRWRMISELRKKAEKNGFKYRRFYKNIFLIRNRSSKYDLVIYNDERLYAVKLWSSYFLRSELEVGRNGKVRERRAVPPVFSVLSGGRGARGLMGPAHSVARTYLPRKYTKSERRIENILLIYPSYNKISVYDGVERSVLGTGDELFGKKIFSPSAFFCEIEQKAANG